MLDSSAWQRILSNETFDDDNVNATYDSADDDALDAVGDDAFGYLEEQIKSKTSFSQQPSPINLTIIWFGIFSLVASMVFFALAIHFEWIDDLVPRIANRPKAIVKNVIQSSLSEKYKNKIYMYPFAWILWSYHLTYKQCIAGIPGTGTRKEGREGPLLKLNIDGIILLKFHALMFKIGVLVAILCLVIILPINATASCDVDVFGVGTCKLAKGTTNFERTTIAHIPDSFYNDDLNATTSYNITTGSILSDISIINVVNEESGNSDNQSGFQRLWVPSQSWRVSGTLICCLLIYAYTLYLLTQEWIENVALRRAFFLEAGHYGNRMIELNKLHFKYVKKTEKKDDNDKNCGLRDDIEELPPYLTHPEIRETPPSIGLYSVLYQLPNSMVTYDTDGAKPLERQLVATKKFFDEIVPPQPGFSSSVAAVTMLPKAELVAKTWNKWSVCERKLQTLRHIRKKLAEARKKEKNHEEEVTFDEQQGRKTEDSELGAKNCVESGDDGGIKVTHSTGLDGVTKLYGNGADGDIETSLKKDTQNNDDENDSDVVPLLEATKSSRTEIFRYEDFDVKLYARSMGYGDEIDRVSEFVDGMGIEEFSVFAYMCSLMAGGPGLNKKVLEYYSIESLEAEEQDLLEELDEAHQDLIDARTQVILDDDEKAVESNDDSIRQGEKSKGSLILNQGDENNEWLVSAKLPDSELQIFETRTSTKPRKCSKIVHLIKRVFVGPDTISFDPKHYGIDSNQNGKAFLTNTEHPSYAVITFTSRQAAIIARQCLADGEAINHWKQVDGIPTFPLADAPPLMCYPRGCCRPITPTISYASKKIRRWIVAAFLVFFTCTAIYFVELINSALLNPNIYANYFGIPQEALNGILPLAAGLTQILLFSLCPVIFRSMANIEGVASSMEIAEQRAIIFFWYFYVVARYLGTITWETVKQIFFDQENQLIETVLYSAVQDLARAIPTSIGPLLLTYVITSTLVSWPILYFLQINNFWTSWVRLRWINRCLKGGGPGAEIPYRIYVDSAFTFSCMVAVAPLCPLMGPFALLYFIVISPMLRWLTVFAYRPRFDSGGAKWPQLFHMIISSLILGQVLTAVTLILKGNPFLGSAAGICIVPTLVYNSIIQDKFLRPFLDASLRYTGSLNRSHQEEQEGIDSWMEREEFRRWLVDCHKAAYLPTCLSGGKKNLITAEPAMVIPKVSQQPPSPIGRDSIVGSNRSLRNLLKRQEGQKGGIMRQHRFGI